MLFNLSFKNIKKSIKDYSIYFFTLVVGVCIFYVFNSLDTQESMLMMSESKYQVVKILVQLLGYVSVFISIILCFLIVYSNNFIIKRRKKEFGLYLTLGMSKRKVSLILVVETLIVGLVSLVVGLLLGVFLSQFLSIFTAKLFEVNMTKYAFVFSSNALVKTIIYFSIIFILVMIFNVTSVSKNKLIDLLNASKVNEKVKMRNKYVVIISFILAISLLGYAYSLLFGGAMFSFDKKAIYMLLSGAIGTYFLFFSLSGMFLTVSSLAKKFYYNNLNMFVLKQINSKANTTVISNTVISLMLLLTIGILSGAISLVSVFNGDMDSNNRTDITIYKYSINDMNDYNGDIVNVEDGHTVMEIVKQDFFSKYIKNYAVYSMYYQEDITMMDLLTEQTINDLKKEYGSQVSFDSSLGIMSESDYNKIMDLYNLSKMKVDLKENEYMLTSNSDKTTEIYSSEYQNGKKLVIGGNELTPVSKDIIDIGFENYSGDSNFGTLIVDDSNVQKLTSMSTVILGDYVDGIKDIYSFEKEFTNKLSYYGPISYETKLAMQDSNAGMKALLTFVGLYLGIVFAISSATVLAIGQLSESSDNKTRYLVLKQIGADNKMINKALLSQIAVAFIFPLVIALFHSFFGLRELNKMIELFGHMDLSKSIFLTSIFIIFIYGGYFVATYLCSKNIIKEN